MYYTTLYFTEIDSLHWMTQNAIKMAKLYACILDKVLAV